MELIELAYRNRFKSAKEIQIVAYGEFFRGNMVKVKGHTAKILEFDGSGSAYLEWSDGYPHCWIRCKSLEKA